MPEWFKGAVLRTAARPCSWVRTPLSAPQAPIAQLVERQAVNL